MARKVSVKFAIVGCHNQRKMTFAEREKLRRVGRENNATAGLTCPNHVRAAFGIEFGDIDTDVPLEELLVEASKETPRWRVMLTPLPGVAGEPDSQSTPGWGDRDIQAESTIDGNRVVRTVPENDARRYLVQSEGRRNAENLAETISESA